LAEPTSCEFNEKPLKEVVEFFAERHKLAIKLDEKALADAGVELDKPITAHLPGIKLESALNLILNQHDLAYFLDKEELIVTTHEVADAKLVKVVYAVQDLVATGDFDSLIGAITGVVQPVSWTEVGGAATIAEDRNQGNLVIEQTYLGHSEIERLVTDLRAATR
jgi:hypothetical protein